MTENGRPVLVTTSHRGVFFGFTDEPSATIIERKIAALRRARLGPDDQSNLRRDRRGQRDG